MSGSGTGAVVYGVIYGDGSVDIRKLKDSDTPRSDGCDGGADVSEEERAEFDNVMKAYTDHEAASIARSAQTGADWSTHETAVPATAIVAAKGLRYDAWRAFLDSPVGRYCVWEISDEQRDGDNVCGRCAFLFDAWANEPRVRQMYMATAAELEDATASAERTGVHAPSDSEAPGIEHDHRSEAGAADDESPQNGRQRGVSGASNEGDGAVDNGGDDGANDAGDNEDVVASVQCDELLRDKFGLAPREVGASKTQDAFYKWSTISRVAKVGNANFKKFKKTKKFTDNVTDELADTCKKVGVAHVLSPRVALAVLSMCDKA